jgi:transposase-like protein
MQRKVHSAEFKAKVALEALKEQKTVNEIAGVFKVHPTQVSQWKRHALDELSQLFSQKRGRQVKEQEELKMALYQEIGQLKFELDWVKKEMGILPGNQTRVGGTGPSQADGAAAMPAVGVKTILPPRKTPRKADSGATVHYHRRSASACETAVLPLKVSGRRTCLQQTRSVWLSFSVLVPQGGNQAATRT